MKNISLQWMPELLVEKERLIRFRKNKVDPVSREVRSLLIRNGNLLYMGT